MGSLVAQIYNLIIGTYILSYFWANTILLILSAKLFQISSLICKLLQKISSLLLKNVLATVNNTTSYIVKVVKKESKRFGESVKAYILFQNKNIFSYA